MKALAVLSLVVLGFAYTQKLPVLQPAQPVDIRVQSFNWHPRGGALIYSRAEDVGIGIGIYRPGDAEGKVVLHLGAEDKWNVDWFANSTSALVTVYRKVKTTQGDGTEGDVYLIDGKQKTAYEVFARTVLGPDEIAIESDLSPGLNHAICTVTEGKKSYHVVLPIGGGRMVASPDIDQAVGQGVSGPSWSANGTAIFGPDSSEELGGLVSDLMKKGQNQIVTDDKSGGATIDITTKSEVVERLDSVVASIFARLRPLQPAAGTPVLEVVPSNGVLRQVRSPGPWVEGREPDRTMASTSHEMTLAFKRMRGMSRALWLVVGKPKPDDGNDVIKDSGDADVNAQIEQIPVPDDATGVLVAAHADSAELAPGERAIAYVTDGALFVRQIDPKS